jgi:biopolymer transport protein ExbD
MIDMFSILVIYLLMNFSATGDPFFMGKPGVVLPTAGKAKEMKTAPLLSFVKGTYYLDALTPDGGQLKIEDDSQNLQTIIQSLQKLQLQIKQKTPKEFDGRLNIQADENTPLLYIKRAMSAGTSAGFTSINFVVNPETSTSSALAHRFAEVGLPALLMRAPGILPHESLRKAIRSLGWPKTETQSIDR